MQFEAVENDSADWIHWGDRKDQFSNWTNHSNRLIPVYSWGIRLDDYQGENSAYRDADKLRQIYGGHPKNSVNPKASYMDQTDIYRLQKDAVAAGKKNVILMIVDGMDWQTTQAAAIYKNQKIVYTEGRGNGLRFLDFRTEVSDFGHMVTSPANGDAKIDVSSQIVKTPGDLAGGYSPALGGDSPWSNPPAPSYLLGKSIAEGHTVTDSAASATSMMAGKKTFNGSINIGNDGTKYKTIAHELQENGFAIGVVTSVPISHATPGCAYAHNVTRNDYQDITRDMLGLKSISHRKEPLPGVDVLIGGGWGETKKDDRKKQGDNFIPGNKFLTEDDQKRIDIESGGSYLMVQRQAGSNGSKLLSDAVSKAAASGEKMFGFFGTKGGHLPFQTADGNYDPTRGDNKAERYTADDVSENPTLGDMTAAALSVLQSHVQKKSKSGIWLMVECGDVDWANHNNNIDDAIGAVFSGDEAFEEIVNWVEANSNWDETALILTADHGHMMVLDRPEALIGEADTE